MASSFNIKQIISPNNKLELGKGTAKTSLTTSSTNLEVDKLVKCKNGILTGVQFVQTENKEITGTTESSQIGNGVGSLVILTNTLRVGQTFKLTGQGFMTTSVSAPDGTFKIKIGTVELFSGIATLPNSLTNSLIEYMYTFTVRSITNGIASIIGQGRTFINNGTGIGSANMRSLIMTTPVSVDNTIDNTIDVTYKFSDIDNTLTTTNGIIEVIY